MPRTVHTSPLVDRSSGQPATGSEWRTGCDRCGAAYTLEGWLRLSMVAHVESAWLASNVMGWRAEEVIEVRRCARCATHMSRRRPAEADASAESDVQAKGA
jgi:hypothetical protein